MNSVPRSFSIVKLDSSMPGSDAIIKCADGERIFVFLGEIPNMPEHCVVACSKSGKILSGIHTDRFVELTEDEV